MNRKILSGVAACALLFIASCGGDAPKTEANGTPTNSESSSTAADEKGFGKFTNVELTTPLNQTMVAAGKGVYDLKCGSCHRLTGEKLVGPGWKGVTSRRKPEWIMNFATNVEEMLAKDANAMALLEECLVRMPNQNLSDEDARNVLEFMRNNDGVK
ncbi:MAG: cytochrome C [Bacteroidetes bacterium B1(2017)]|nr:MAG: cytochrome C [Bacteroidetes bacterium B1(2017)]